MKPLLACLTITGLLGFRQSAVAATLPASSSPRLPILCPSDPSLLEALAAREVRRYVYLRTGEILPIRLAATPEAGSAGAFVVARKDRPLARSLAGDGPLALSLDSLEPQQFWLRTVKPKGRPVLLLTGGDDVGTLYAAYRLAEQLGVRFYLHGDVIPEDPIPLRIPFLDERHMPLFDLRGILPFHDFPEGPDWWNLDDYLAILAQLPKLRMNFFGLHTYPENAPNAEPTVWIGASQDIEPDGRVTHSYPASYQNTLRGNWGYEAKKTSEFIHGGALLFDHDAFGPDVMAGLCPQPVNPTDCNTVFNRTAALLRQAFAFARCLDVRTCVGTETPLTIPKQVQDRLKALGKDPTDPAALLDLYTGMFSRIACAYPLDYYWFWTPEGWTWEGTRQDQIQRTLGDVQIAAQAAANARVPFRLATCGWVLGPQQDRALFDKVLPKEIALSCINREVGRTPVDSGFAQVTGRGKWAIPWMEDDPALTSPQLWAGRMRRDAADARRYGCDGLMGIHWRTRVLGPNVAALAQAAWDQSKWNRNPFAPPPAPPRVAGPVGGSSAAFPGHPIADTDNDEVYQTVRYNLSAFFLPASSGKYRVTLEFCEPHYDAPAKRSFGVRLEGKPVIDQLDIFAKVGKDRALDFTFPDIVVTDGWLDIEFVPIVEYPSIAGIVLEGPQGIRRINVGGPAIGDYEAEPRGRGDASAPLPTVDDFYLDWTIAEFGIDVAPAAAALFERIDGRLPRPSDWVDGPGGIRPDNRPWEKVAPDYTFVDDLEALRPNVRGPGNLARFDYWLSTFKYLRAMARVNCVWAAFNTALAQTQQAADPAHQKRLARERALPLRQELVRHVGEVYRHLLATVSTPGELGTVANWDQHLLPGLLGKAGQELAQLLGTPLPPDAQPAPHYSGPTRLILPTHRSIVLPGEPFSLEALVLSEQKPAEGWIRWRRLGTGAFMATPLVHLDRGVYRAVLPPACTADDFEYFAEMTDARDRVVRAPESAPALNHTVVVMSQDPR